MKYKVFFSDKAEKDFKSLIKSGNKILIKKIDSLLEDVSSNPYSGLGKPEPLKYELSGRYSRRIDREHRMIYAVLDDEKSVQILSLKGHYEK